MKKWFFIKIVFIFLLLPSLAMATINSDLNHFFNSLGYDANVTNPQAYHGQEAGYYTGGSLYARNSVRDIQLASVQLPSYRGGCGGIDLFTGGFSFINSKQLEAAMKNIANNATNYAFMLAVKSVSPLIANTMEDLQTWANKVNNMNINSCEAGASLVGSIWPKTDIAQQNVCASIGTQSGIFGDWAAARQGCGSGGQRSGVLNGGMNNPQYKYMIMNNTNIAWQAIEKNGFLSADSSLAELFMSLSGTIIVKHEGSDDKSPSAFSVLPSLATNRQLVKALLYGGQAKIYHCDETTKCLNPSMTTITINKGDALGDKVKALLQDMVNHIYNDTPLTKEEIGLLQATPLPVYKMLNVQSAYVGDPDILDVSQYADVIASGILYQYINESLQIVQASASALQYPQPILTKFMDGINAARLSVSQERSHAYKQINETVALIERTQTLEQQLAGDLSEQMTGNLQWANGMR